MGQASRAYGVVRRSQLAVAFALVVSGSAAVAADLRAEGRTSDNGAMQFPNVRVINAPQAVQTTTAESQRGMRAYKDSATGELRGPTSEEMAEAAATPMVTSSARRAATTEASSSEAPSFMAAGGGVGVMLDESSLQYSVVVRQADGSLAEVCVTGADAADEVVRKQVVSKTAAHKEITNVR